MLGCAYITRQDRERGPVEAPESLTAIRYVTGVRYATIPHHPTAITDKSLRCAILILHY
jgi:hypothetical protein